jgi:hypothetical protein
MKIEYSCTVVAVGGDAMNGTGVGIVAVRAHNAELVGSAPIRLIVPRLAEYAAAKVLGHHAAVRVTIEIPDMVTVPAQIHKDNARRLAEAETRGEAAVKDLADVMARLAGTTASVTEQMHREQISAITSGEYQINWAEFFYRRRRLYDEIGKEKVDLMEEGIRDFIKGVEHLYRDTWAKVNAKHGGEVADSSTRSS